VLSDDTSCYSEQLISFYSSRIVSMFIKGTILCIIKLIHKMYFDFKSLLKPNILYSGIKHLVLVKKSITLKYEYKENANKYVCENGYCVTINWYISTEINKILLKWCINPFLREHIVKNGRFHWKTSCYKFKLLWYYENCFNTDETWHKC
jgi:hypothetical protein